MGCLTIKSRIKNVQLLRRRRRRRLQLRLRNVSTQFAKCQNGCQLDLLMWLAGGSEGVYCLSSGACGAYRLFTRLQAPSLAPLLCKCCAFLKPVCQMKKIQIIETKNKIYEIHAAIHTYVPHICGNTSTPLPPLACGRALCIEHLLGFGFGFGPVSRCECKFLLLLASNILAFAHSF